MFDKITKNKKYIFFAIISLMILGGILRWQQVGKYTLWIDELFNVSAAQSILETGKPLLPSGYLYTRALPYTYAVVTSFNLFGVSEESARLPSVFFAILTIPMIFLLGRELFSIWTGLIAAFILTFHTYHIVWSVQGRMYTMGQFMYVVLLYATVKAFKISKNSILRSCFWGILALGAFFCAVKIHRLTLMFLPALLTNALIYVIWADMYRNRFIIKRAQIIKYALILVAMGCAVYIDAVFGSNWVLGQISQLRSSIPTWGIENAYQLHFYRYFLQKNFPVFVCVFPFALTLFLLKKPVSGIFLGAHFVVPFLLLSISTWKADRYIFLFMPVFFLISAFFMEQVFDVFHSKLRSLSSTAFYHKKKIILGVAFYISVLSILLGPRVRLRAKDFIGLPKHSAQKMFADFIDRTDPNAVIISLEPLFFKFYFKRLPDYSIQYFGKIEKGNLVGSKDNTQDGATGYNIVRSVSELIEIEDKNSQIWIISLKPMLSPEAFISKEIKEYILDNYVIADGINGRIYFYKRQRS